ncbi:unannotated protein [freshwater metagenome]|uniref:Unannotated protein n=1 Tax=freshwater metagenome TaxID=449393 RepID=A0A6J6BL89_9ZZZZ
MNRQQTRVTRWRSSPNWNARQNTFTPIESRDLGCGMLVPPGTPPRKCWPRSKRIRSSLSLRLWQPTSRTPFRATAELSSSATRTVSISKHSLRRSSPRWSEPPSSHRCSVRSQVKPSFGSTTGRAESSNRNFWVSAGPPRTVPDLPREHRWSSPSTTPHGICVVTSVKPSTCSISRVRVSSFSPVAPAKLLSESVQWSRGNPRH